MLTKPPRRKAAALKRSSSRSKSLNVSNSSRSSKPTKSDDKQKWGGFGCCGKKSVKKASAKRKPSRSSGKPSSRNFGYPRRIQPVNPAINTPVEKESLKKVSSGPLSGKKAAAEGKYASVDSSRKRTLTKECPRTLTKRLAKPPESPFERERKVLKHKKIKQKSKYGTDRTGSSEYARTHTKTERELKKSEQKLDTDLLTTLEELSIKTYQQGGRLHREFKYHISRPLPPKPEPIKVEEKTAVEDPVKSCAEKPITEKTTTEEPAVEKPIVKKTAMKGPTTVFSSVEMFFRCKF